mmetsp:Transcript_165361/g.530711  ORF Transcript_165361/g.530711 Transcript_165361/m.530711 type:complete len:134 (-) Transcript_165361:59-460(-)
MLALGMAFRGVVRWSRHSGSQCPVESAQLVFRGKGHEPKLGQKRVRRVQKARSRQADLFRSGRQSSERSAIRSDMSGREGLILFLKVEAERVHCRSCICTQMRRTDRCLAALLSKRRLRLWLDCSLLAGTRDC